MAASSTTGVGTGAANKLDVKDLITLMDGPIICFVGSTETIGVTPTATVKFPKPLSAPTDDYGIILTSENGGAAWVTNQVDDDYGNFLSFSIASESPGTIWYLVIKKGFRAI